MPPLRKLPARLETNPKNALELVVGRPEVKVLGVGTWDGRLELHIEVCGRRGMSVMRGAGRVQGLAGILNRTGVDGCYWVRNLVIHSWFITPGAGACATGSDESVGRD